MFTTQDFLNRVKRHCDEHKTSEAALLRKADVAGSTLTLLRKRLDDGKEAGLNSTTQAKIAQAMEKAND